MRTSDHASQPTERLPNNIPNPSDAARAAPFPPPIFVTSAARAALYGRLLNFGVRRPWHLFGELLNIGTRRLFRSSAATQTHLICSPRVDPLTLSSSRGQTRQPQNSPCAGSSSSPDISSGIGRSLDSAYQTRDIGHSDSLVPPPRSIRVAMGQWELCLIASESPDHRHETPHRRWHHRCSSEDYS